MAARPTSPVARAWIAAALVGAGRAAVTGLQLARALGGLNGFGVREILAEALITTALALPVTLVAALLARRGRARALLVGLGVAVLAYLHLTHRLPPGPIVLVPGFASTAGVAVNGALVLLALAAAWVAAPALPLPAVRALAGLAGVGAAGAGLTLVLLRPARAEWPTRPNLVLISIDTLRADRLGCYGYDLATSPNLDAFAERSMRFERAYTTDAWTLTAHASMLTGLGPLAHGVDREVALSTQVPTLAERLADAGYTTLGVVDSCVWLDQRYGLGRGFDAYRVVKGDARVKAREAQYLLDRAGDAPFFLFFHVYDVHSDWEHLPYEADPEDHAALAGWYEGEFQACDDEGRCASEYLQALNSRGEVLEGADRRYLASLYDAGVRSLDRRLGELFAALEERGVFENSVVILTSDHGEEFFEHGKCLHSTHHEVCVRVPLLVRTPDTQGEVSRSLSSSVDLAPTLLDYAGLALGEVQGRSLRPALSGDVEAEGHAYVSTARGGVVYSVRDHEWALVLDESGWVVVGPQGPMPLEQAPPEVGARLLAWVERERRLGLELAARFGGGDISAPLTESEQRSLRALGYGGGD